MPDSAPLLAARRATWEARQELRTVKAAHAEAQAAGADQVQLDTLMESVTHKRQLLRQRKAELAAVKEQADDDD